MIARKSLGKPTAFSVWEGRGRRNYYVNKPAADGIGGGRWKEKEEAEPRSRPPLAGGEVSLWVPHPRTGIYYPRGHEWVMEDVPDGAATFQEAFWLRNQEDSLVKAARQFSPTHRAPPAMDALEHICPSM